MTLTVAYFTSRKAPMIEWFFASLHRETGGDFTNMRIVIVDLWQEERANRMGHRADVDFWHVAPKPCVWQGKYRRTKIDWFSASNARNTAICLAPDGWIAFVDDLSVLTPGWLKAVREAMTAEKVVTCGAYRKVGNLTVAQDGTIESFDDRPSGHDNRWKYGNDECPVKCEGNWMYGCSLVAPVEAFLSINGFPEALCDGMSFEDVIAGIMLSKKGYSFQYDRRMLTLEDDDLHSQLPVMKRSDYGVSPNDKSHAVLSIAQNGDGWHPNYFGDEGVRGLRQRVLAGEPFPICRIPEHEWYTGTRLEDL
jgi:hypothetical protein